MFILENILKSLNKKNSITIKRFTKITHASGLYLLSKIIDDLLVFNGK
jgi:hypothetical protein